VNELLGPDVYTKTTTSSVPKLLVSTFVPGRIPTCYKCGDDTFIYQVGVIPGTNVGIFVPGQTPTPCTNVVSRGASGPILPPGINTLICTEGKNTWYKRKVGPGTNAGFSSSVF
jgi:hypothetical protein